MPRIIYHIALIVLLFTPSAQAAEVNKAGTSHLKALFSEILDNQRASIERAGGTLKTDGEIAVEQGHDYYAVTLPAMTFTDEDGSTAKIGLIAVNVTPTDLADEWKMSIALPTPILYEEANTKKMTQLDIGEQNMSGVWNERLKNFSKLSARYNNLKISQNLRAETLAVKQLDIAVDLQETQKGYWSGPTKFGLSGLSFGKPDTPRLAFADSIKFAVTVDDFSPAAQKEVLQKISNNLADKESGEAGNEEDDTPNLFLMLLRHSGKSVNLQGAVSQLEINAPIMTGQKNRNFSLESGSFLFDMDGMQQGLINQTFKIAYRGLKVPQNKDASRDILPSVFQTNLSLKNLPLTELFDIGSELLPSEEKNKKSKQIATLQAMITLPQILSKAGTTVTLTETKFSNDIYKATLEGVLQASTKSLLGTMGHITLKMTGLDDLTQKLEEKSATALPADKSKIEKSLKRLKFIQKISKKQDNEYICHVELGEKAKLSINGADLDDLEDKPLEQIGQ